MEGLCFRRSELGLSKAMSEPAKNKKQPEASAPRRRVRIINPTSTFYGWQGSTAIPGLMTPEDNLAVLFPTLDKPIHFRSSEIEETDE